MGLSLSVEEGNQNNATAPQLPISINNTMPSVNVSGVTLEAETSSPQTQSSGFSYDTRDDAISISPDSGRSLDSSKQSDNSNATDLINPISTNRTETISNDNDDFKFNLFGTYVYPFKWLTLPTLYSWLGPLSSVGMIIGCVMPYVPQYRTIHKYHNSSGFSTFVCLTLFIANILRIAFWFGHPFEYPLLIQSVIMIIAQLLLLELCVRIKWQNSSSRIHRKFLRSSLRFFWRWTDLLSYLEFLCLISALLAVAMHFLINCELFVETIGYCALVIESMLGLPQVIKNYRNRSVEGMSLSMVFMWLAGDTFKTGYFIANDVPFQFWLCGLLQITIDLLILFQVCLFKQNAPVKKSSYSLKERALSVVG